MLLKLVDYLGTAILGKERYRYEQFKRAKKLARHHGFEVYKTQLIWQSDPEFLSALQLSKARDIVGIPSDRCYMLLEAARHVRDVPGAIAECGTRFGKSALFILTGLGPDSDKPMHIFDSFEGVSAPSEGDLDEAGRAHWERGELAVAEDVVRQNLQGFAERLTMHKGWIPERFPDVEGETFSLVHIDVDLYDPTRDSVEFFYPRMSPGGIILCDDYGSAYCPGAKKAIDEFFADKPEPVFALPTGQSMIIKR